MRITNLRRLAATAVAALALGGLATSSANAHHNCANADYRPTRSTSPDLHTWMVQNAMRAKAAADALVCLTNAERDHRRLRPLLIVNRELTAAAHAHSWDMKNRRYFDHLSPDNPPTNPCTRAARAGFTGSCAHIRENLSTGSGPHSTPRARFNSMMNSPTHFANIISRASRYIGVGVILYAYDRETRAWDLTSTQAATYTQMFGA